MRKDITFLRAFSVILVVLFHLRFTPFQHGYLGVDCFFVISGFVITKSIDASLGKKTFSLSSFYIRRARRLLPSLFTVLFLSSISVFFLFAPTERNRYGWSLISSLLSMSNFYFYKTINYFTSSQPTPLLHTWSLSVEEQFYICLSLLIVLLVKFKRKSSYSSSMFLFLVPIGLLGYSYWESKNNNNFSFYLLPCRAWELALGVISARVVIKYANLQRYKVREFVAIVGLALIVVSLIIQNSEGYFPNLGSLLICLGTSLLLLFQANNRIFNYLTQNKSVQYLGLRSYTIYLVH